MSSDLRTVIEINGDGSESDLEQTSGVMSDSGAITGQYRCWFFTINNPTDEWDEGGGWSILQRVVSTITAGVYQHEKVTVDHIQGCFKTEQKVRPTTMKNKFRSRNIRGWIKPCIDFQKSIKYCTKEETRVDGPYYFGDLTANNKNEYAVQGKRTDLSTVAADIDAGKTMCEIARAHPTAFIKYHHGVREYKEVTTVIKPRDFMTQLHIFWGVAGTGKSRRAWYEAQKRGSVYQLPARHGDSNVIWWPGYSGQDTVIIEDYYGWFPFHEFLKLIDRYEYKVRTKGDNFAQFVSKYVIITANSPYTKWYAKEFMQEANWKEAFERRCALIEEFTANTKWIPPEERVSDLQIDTSDLAFLDPGDQGSPISVYNYMKRRHELFCRQSHECDCDEFHSRKFPNTLPM